MTLTAERDTKLIGTDAVGVSPSRKTSWFKRAGMAVGGIALAAGISVIGAPQAQATYWPMAGSYPDRTSCFAAAREYQAQYPAYTASKCERISDGSIKLFMWTND